MPERVRSIGAQQPLHLTEAGCVGHCEQMGRQVEGGLQQFRLRDAKREPLPRDGMREGTHIVVGEEDGNAAGNHGKIKSTRLGRLTGW